MRVPLASLAECYEDEDAAPPLLPSPSPSPLPPQLPSSPSDAFSLPCASAAAAQARTTVLAAECPEHFLIRPRSPYSRVRRHSVFRFCFRGGVAEAGQALAWLRRLGPLAAARAGRGGGGNAASSSSAAAAAAASASARAAAADAALASLVRQLQDSTSFSADDFLPLRGGGIGGGSAPAAEENKRGGGGGGGGGVALLGRRVLGLQHRLRRRRKGEEEEEEGEEEEEAASSPPSSPVAAASAAAPGSVTSGTIAFECRALRITPLVSEPGRAAVSASGDLLFKPVNGGGGGGGGGTSVLLLPAASIGALVAREWGLRDCGLEAFAAPVFEDGYGKEFEASPAAAAAEADEQGGAEAGGRSGKRRASSSFDYRASFSRSSPSVVPAAATLASSSSASSPLASPRPLSGVSSPEMDGGGNGGGGDRRLLRRRRSSLSGNRSTSSLRAPRRLPRSAPPSVFLAFESAEDRDAVAEALVARASSSSSNSGGGGCGGGCGCGPTLALDPERRQARLLAAESAKSWLAGEISTYAHLLRLNLLSGRSFHDLGKYPVFPWVLSDYESEELDLSGGCFSSSSSGGKEAKNNDDDDDEKGVASSSPSSSPPPPPPPPPPLPPPPFRDLSRPVGALGSNPARLREFRERYRDLEQMARAVRAGEESAAAAAAAGVSFFCGCRGRREKEKKEKNSLSLSLPSPPPPPPPSLNSRIHSQKNREGGRRQKHAVTSEKGAAPFLPAAPPYPRRSTKNKTLAPRLPLLLSLPPPPRPPPPHSWTTSPSSPSSTAATTRPRGTAPSGS